MQYAVPGQAGRYALCAIYDATLAAGAPAHPARLPVSSTSLVLVAWQARDRNIVAVRDGPGTPGDESSAPRRPGP